MKRLRKVILGRESRRKIYSNLKAKSFKCRIQMFTYTSSGVESCWGFCWRKSWLICFSLVVVSSLWHWFPYKSALIRSNTRSSTRCTVACSRLCCTRRQTCSTRVTDKFFLLRRFPSDSFHFHFNASAVDISGNSELTLQIRVHVPGQPNQSFGFSEEFT